MPRKRSKQDLSPSSSDDASGGAVVVPKLASIPAELFDEIMSYFPTLPHQWYYDTATAGIPDLRYAERTMVLQALAMSCKAVREVSLPRLWSRIDCCWVPPSSNGTWYKYVMQELQRKSKGVLAADAALRGYVRTVTFTLTKSDVKGTMPAITTLLSALPALHTIQILSCKIAGDFKNAVTYLSLPTVHTLIIPTDANALVRACPNVKHVRCAGGHGSALVGSLKGSKCETLDGMIDWVKDRKLTERLVKSVPLLHTLEIRRPVNRGLGILSQNTAPAQWAQVIPSLAGLKQLRVLILTFPRRDEVPSDRASIDAARDVLRNSELGGEKKLIIRRIEAPHYENNPPHDPDKDLDLLLSESTEIFTSE